MKAESECLMVDCAKLSRYRRAGSVLLSDQRFLQAAPSRKTDQENIEEQFDER